MAMCVEFFPKSRKIGGIWVFIHGQAGGPIRQIFVKDGEAVVKNQELLYLDNPASLTDVRTFATLVGKTDSIEHIPDYLYINVPENLQLGELRQTYTGYVQTLKTFRYVLKQGIVFQQIAALEQKIDRQQQLAANLQKQQTLFEKELSLAEKDYHRQQELNRQGLVSDLDFEKNEAAWLQKQQRNEDLGSALVRNQIEIAQLRTQRLELMDARAKTVSDYVIQLRELSLRFRNEYAQWLERYMVIAPADGTVSFIPGLHQHKTVKPGEPVASIIPGEATRNGIVARINPPAGGIGKIEHGNRVLLQLDAYPHKEYGTLDATVNAISRLPVQDGEGQLFYEITCHLPDSLVTSIGKPLPFRQRLTGTAQVITKDQSIMERVLDRLLAIKQ